MARTVKKLQKKHMKHGLNRHGRPKDTADLRIPLNRKSHKGEQVNRWDPQAMLNAIQEFRQQVNDDNPGEHKLSLRGIARAHNVPFESLRRRISGPASLNAHTHLLGKKTVLPKAAEIDLAGHIKELAAVGFPCSRDDIRTLAYEYAVKNNIKGFSVKKQKAGYYWFDGFMSRFPDLVVKSAENLSVPRAMGMNPTQVSQWFSSYEGILQRLGIHDCPSHIWNFDETGCQNIHFAQEIVGQVGVPTYNITALEKGETSTALIGINAVGDTPPPMIIHRGKYVGKGWSNGAMHNTLVRASEKGYINKELFLEFGKSFIVFLQNQNLIDDKPHIVVLDSHYSHLYNIEFLELMKGNKIHVFALPAHCSHWLQPLDRGIFRSFKNAWNEEMKKYTRAAAGRKLEKRDFFLVFNAAFQKSMTVANAQGAFRGSGIFPCNLSAIPQHAFAPSATTERPNIPSALGSSSIDDHAAVISSASGASLASPTVLVTASSSAYSGTADLATEIANPVSDASPASLPVLVTTSSSTISTAALSAAGAEMMASLTSATVCDLMLATSSTSGTADVAMEIANSACDASLASPPVLVTTSSSTTGTVTLSAADAEMTPSVTSPAVHDLLLVTSFTSCAADVTMAMTNSSSAVLLQVTVSFWL